MTQDTRSKSATSLTRRDLLRAGGALSLGVLGAGIAAACGPAAGPSSWAAAGRTGAGAVKPPQPVSMRLGWLANSQYAGDFVAFDKGYYKERGIDLRIDPGGPNIDPVSLTASGSNTIGNVASIAAMFLARSNGIPVRAFATALQRHPFAFITLDQKINSPQDFVGKKIGIQATARPLIDAVIAKYQLPRDKIEISVIGSDTVPLQTGQVDIINSLAIDGPQIAAAGPGAKTLLLLDLCIQLYAVNHFPRVDALKYRPGKLVGLLWAIAH